MIIYRIRTVSSHESVMKVEWRCPYGGGFCFFWAWDDIKTNRGLHGWFRLKVISWLQSITVNTKRPNICTVDFTTSRFYYMGTPCHQAWPFKVKYSLAFPSHYPCAIESNIILQVRQDTPCSSSLSCLFSIVAMESCVIVWLCCKLLINPDWEPAETSSPSCHTHTRRLKGFAFQHTDLHS